MRFFIVLFLSGISASYTSVAATDTIKLYFDIGIAVMKPASKSAIDSHIYYENIATGKKLGIIGYADYLGDETANVGLSERRAKNVQNYLVSMGIKAEDIQVVTGKGEVKRDATGPQGYAEDRRVDIIPGGFKEMPKPKQVLKPVVVPTPPAAVAKIDVATIKKGQAIRLNKIFFYPGSHKVREVSLPELDNLYATMNDNPTLKIRIEGHICCLTPKNTDGFDYDTQDFKLSVNRAKAIYDYLEEKGIAEDRLEYQGFGRDKPLVKIERTAEDEDMNRRVEIRVLEK